MMFILVLGTVVAFSSCGKDDEEEKNTVTTEENKDDNKEENTQKPSGKPAASITPEAVDLGLPSGVLWATFNVGASAPEEFGDFYAWGEVTTKEIYNYENYTRDNYGYGKDGVLTPEHDVAHVKWGGEWRMPTRTELIELYKKCTWEWTTLNNVNGYKVISKSNGASIFLPAAGYSFEGKLLEVNEGGNYWTSSYDSTPSQEYNHTYGMDFYSNKVRYDYSFGPSKGFSVRPVKG